ncbi:hypothetical protein [Listeria booriae]|nr:hypothetical protein [Listeria booriae]MBC1513517.1 hypothetical protein [Listeria booriae]MBC6152346.1 hypothetical protein [Listeria booriae]MBC6307183.1 hypothetical protein [Listeria booriae]
MASFESQLLEVFPASIKIKGGFLLRLLQTFSELNGLSQLFVLSSFESQLLEVFTASIKIKRGFLLRLLQTFSELSGLFQLFVVYLKKTIVMRLSYEI